MPLTQAVRNEIADGGEFGKSLAGCESLSEAYMKTPPALETTLCEDSES